MKYVAFSFLYLSLNLALGNESKSISYDLIESRNVEDQNLKYHPDQKEPFSGTTTKIYNPVQDDGIAKVQNNWKDGKKDGVSTLWRESDLKMVEQYYVSGKKQSETQWHENGQKKSEKFFENGLMFRL